MNRKWIIKYVSNSKIHAVKIVTRETHSEIATIPHVYELPTMGKSEGMDAAELMVNAPELMEMVERLTARLESVLRFTDRNDPNIDEKIATHPDLVAARELIYTVKG